MSVIFKIFWQNTKLAQGEKLQKVIKAVNTICCSLYKGVIMVLYILTVLCLWVPCELGEVFV